MIGDAALWPLAGRRVKAACGETAQRLSLSRMSKADEERAKRLAEALRQNLRRRKAQTRGESAPPRPAPTADEER
jgi:hypothetical protein